jgi:hypothetical protein
MTRHFGRAFDHRLTTLEELAERQEKTKVVWNQIFPGEVFELPKCKEEIVQLYGDANVWTEKSKLEFDIVASAIRDQCYKTFYGSRLRQGILKGEVSLYC